MDLLITAACCGLVGYILGRSHEYKPPVTNLYLEVHHDYIDHEQESERWWESN